MNFKQKFTLGVLNRLLMQYYYRLWQWHPRRFSRHLDNIVIDRPIFLLGVQGGGLTLLSRMLRRHPEVISVTGNHRLWAGADEMQNVMDSFLPAALTGLHQNIPPNASYPERIWLYAIDELLPLYRQTAANATPQLKQRLQKAIRIPLAIYGNGRSSVRFIDKSQTFTVRLSLIQTLLADHNPHFILETRNPYALCYRAVTKVETFQRLPISFEEKLALAAQHWTNSMNLALKDAASMPHFMTVRFEDIVQSPQNWLPQICEFVKLPFDPTMIPAADHQFPLGSTGSSKGDHKWYPLRPDVNRPYLSQLNSQMIEIVDNYVGELASQWQYSPDGP